MLHQIIAGDGLDHIFNGSYTSQLSSRQHSNSEHLLGLMRYDIPTNQIKVYDGTEWVNINYNYQTIALSCTNTELLAWVAKKKEKEEKYNKLAESNPSIKVLLEQKQKIESTLELVTAMISNE